MLSSISPLGERARASRWWVTTTAYVLGSVVGGLAIGLLAALLGSLVPADARRSPWLLLPLAALLLVGLVLDLGEGGRTVPSWRRQVAESWLGRYRGWVIGVGFGTQLGFGLVTIITSNATYAVVLLAALSGQAGAGLAIGGVFGLVRALPAVLMRGVHTPEQLRGVFTGLQRWARPAERMAQAALGLAGGVLVVVAVSGLAAAGG